MPKYSVGDKLKGVSKRVSNKGVISRKCDESSYVAKIQTRTEKKLLCKEEINRRKSNGELLRCMLETYIRGKDNDIALLQETEKTRLNVAEQSANPAKIVPETMKGKEQFQPGGYNYIRNPEMRPTQLDVGTNYPITLEITDAMADNVKEWFAVDTFTALRQMDGLQNATATAVAAMQGEQTALLTPMVTNLYQGLAPAIVRTFNILAKKQLLPPMPFALQQMGGNIKLDFLGVLAQAQKAAYEFGGIMDVLGIASQFAQFGESMPEFARAVHWLKPDMVFRKSIESRSAPADIMRNEEEYQEVIAKMEQEQAAAMQQAQQAQIQQAVIQNSGKLGEPVKPNSPLAQMTSALGGKKR